MNYLPIIKTFMHNNKYYMYDTYTNRILMVSKSLFVGLSNIEKFGISNPCSLSDKKSCDAIQALITKGMLKSDFISFIERDETAYIADLVNNGVNDVSLQITQNCNFKCRYCMFANESNIDRRHQNVNMTWDVARRSIDFVYTHSIDCKFINMAFYGGEPLLNFKTIKQVVDYCDKLFISKKIIYSMTTNLSILTDEMIDFFKDNGFRLSISLDGGKDVQNKHRKFAQNGIGSFEVVYNNVEKLRKRQPDYFDKSVNFLPVILTDEDHEDVLSFFESVNIKAEKIHFLEADFSGNDYYYNDYDSNKNSFFSRDEIMLTNIEKRMKESYLDKSLLPVKWHHGGMCIPGLRRLFIDVNGTFYPCEKIINRNFLSIGDLDKGFCYKKIDELMNIGKITEKECKKCWAMRFCEICALFCYDVEKNVISIEQKRRACNFQKKRALSFIKKYVENIE